jgi:L-threonylcarbamoyladenylate synthase
MKTILLPSTHPDALFLALEIVKRGGVVAFPTDTVYGIGVSVYMGESIEKLFVAKGRGENKAIPVLVGEVAHLSQVTRSINDLAWRLARHFWPGPLTLIVPRHPALPASLSPLPTVGVRMPDHPFTLGLLKRSGPLATTSANLSGASNPLTAQDVLAQLDGRIDLVLDGGVCPGGVPSTIVDCTGKELKILRQGPISLDDLQAALSEDNM